MRQSQKGEERGFFASSLGLKNDVGEHSRGKKGVVILFKGEVMSCVVERKEIS